MMKREQFLLIFLILSCQFSNGQGRSPRLVSAASPSKHINTNVLFDPEPKKDDDKIVKKENTEIAEPIAKVKKQPERVSKGKKDDAAAPEKPKKESRKNKTENAQVAKADLPAKEEKLLPAPIDPEGLSTIYFDRRFRKPDRQENVYFYRKAKFDKSNNQPKGTVRDFYADSNKPKFMGQFRKYESTYEEKNTDFDGTCVFYQENGDYLIKIYSKGHILKETKYSGEDQVLGQVEYAADGLSRKKYFENVFDKNGKKIEYTEGGLNARTGREEAKQLIFYPNEKLKSNKSLVDGCPSSKGMFYEENGASYEAYFQDFTCNPDLDQAWKFSNKSFFQTNYNRPSKLYEVRADQGKESGILQLSVPYDFYTKPFVIEAIFDLPETRAMNEIGIVWEYQNPNNYSYLKINLSTKTYEINSVKDGKQQKFMVGIKPQPLEISGSQMKVSFRKDSDQQFIYSLNDESLKHTSGGGQSVAYSKFPRVSTENYKIWGIGFYFKSSAINDKITLKSLEVKLL